MNLQLRLKNYITRYAPSREMLTSYLSKKKAPDIDSVLENIMYDEGLMCDMWIRTFIATGKGKRDIERKLLLKRFPRELIKQKIDTHMAEIHNWNEYIGTIENQIDTLLGRNKSLTHIRISLIGKYPYFRDEIDELLDSKDDANALEKEVKKYRNKYTLTDTKGLQKFYSALMRKGFGLREIQKTIRDMDA